jgi:hypothetical protein
MEIVLDVMIRQLLKRHVHCVELLGSRVFDDQLHLANKMLGVASIIAMRQRSRFFPESSLNLIRA